MTERLPREFLEEMKNLLEADYGKYIESFCAPSHNGLRVNTGKLTPEALKKRLPFELKAIPWIADGFFYEEGQPSKDPWYAAGLYYLQEPSAMTPADRLPVQKGERVLDLCAAPGGKATKLAAKLSGTGMLFANDISSSRARGLLKNLELQGFSNICVMSEDPEKLVSRYPEYFDKILIDAPCSGEGMFRREPRMTQDWKERGPSYYVPIQRKLLLQGVSMLKPGGMMMYSTCTFSKAEDEENVAWLLKQCEEMSLCSIAPYEGFTRGFDGLTDCMRIFPHQMEGEGHFLALLKKAGSNSEAVQPIQRKQKETKLPEEAEAFLHKIYWQRDLNWYMVEDKIYGLPTEFAIEKHIRYLRTGLYLGTMKKKRFEPSQALAMTLKAEEFDNTLHLNREDPRVMKYLKGETLDVTDLPVEKGWCLVCLEEFPLGWGKVQNQTLKNKYYSGWRWQ